MAAFRVIPYFACKSLTLPNLDDFLDVSSDRLQEMESSDVSDPDSSNVDASSDIDVDIDEDRSSVSSVDSD